MSTECRYIKREPGSPSPTPKDKYKITNRRPVTETAPLFVNVKQEAMLDHTNVSVKVEIQDETLPVTNSSVVKTEIDYRYEHVPIEYDQTAVSKPSTLVSVKIEPLETEENSTESHRGDKEKEDYIHEEISPFMRDYVSEGTKFSCSICNKEFSNKSNLRRHYDIHNKAVYQCEVCLKKFTNPKLLTSHMKIHGQRAYQCQSCDKSFMTPSNLLQHQRVHVKPFSCDTCRRTFAVEATFIKHKEKKQCSKTVKEPIICPICNKVFKLQTLLKSHLRKHNTEKPYTCDICQLKFKHKVTLIRHIQLHSGIKPFSCNICGKRFTHLGLMKPHMRMHTGEKPFPCPICKKDFSHKHNMERHALGHEKVKKLTCDICNKKFPKESRLKYHLRIHTSEKHFACVLCPKKFAHKQNILRHYSKKHPNAKYVSKDTDASVALKVWDEVVNKKIRKLDKLPEDTVCLPIKNAEAFESGVNEDAEYILPDRTGDGTSVVKVKLEKVESGDDGS